MNDGKFKVGALLLSFLLILGTFKEKDGGIPKNGTPISVVEQNFPSDIHETLEKVEQKEFVKENKELKQELTTREIKEKFLSISALQYTPHTIIQIDGNSAFLDYCFTGLGTFSEPYVLTQISISEVDTHLISITNTDAYFEIKENYLDGINYKYDAIYLQNVTNGVVINNRILNVKNGIHLEGSNSNIINYNTITNTAYDGIKIWASNEVEISDNYIEGGSGNGISLSDACNETLINSNVITENYGLNGIYLGGACDSEVIDNTITELYAGNGITLGYLGLSPKGTYTFIDNNTILGCKRHGISIELASNNTITRNTINGNGENGIMFFASSSNLVELNDIHFNIWDGIMIDGRSRSNEYYSNNIFENDIGISVFNSSFNEFVDNRIDISKTHGMFVVKSDSLLVKSNLIGSSWRNGIEIRESSNLQIISNHFGANSRATELYPELLGAGIYADTFNGIIENNDLWENHYYGIYVNRGSSIQINNNHVSGSGYTGISLHSISDITIYSNTLVRNSGNGIYLRSSNNSLIQTNIFSVNHQYGVNIDYTSEGTIARNNDFFENNLCPGFQANDDGVNNSFDHNYWSNWESEADYFLNGSAGSVDANPSLYALNIPSNSIAEPKVISPNGNERLENTVSVLWEAVHPMGYVPCTYCLFYSPDVGSNWVSVYERDFNPTRTIEEFTWDTTDLKNGDHYLFKVIAVLYTGYATLDTSDTVFSIKNGEIDSATSNISPDTNTTTVKTTTIKTEIEATTIWVTPSFSYLIVNVGMAMIFRFKRQKRKKNEVF